MKTLGQRIFRIILINLIFQIRDKLNISKLSAERNTIYERKYVWLKLINIKFIENLNSDTQNICNMEIKTGETLLSYDLRHRI